MSENEQNLEGTVGTVDLSAVSLQSDPSDDVSAGNVVAAVNDAEVLNSAENVDVVQGNGDIDFNTEDQTASTIDESLFLDE